MSVLTTDLDLGEALPLCWQLVFGEDRIDWARLDAGIAVDALLGVDEQLIHVRKSRLLSGGVDAVNGADLDAREVLDVDAWVGDYVGHDSSAPIGGWTVSAWATPALQQAQQPTQQLHEDHADVLGGEVAIGAGCRLTRRMVWDGENWAWGVGLNPAPSTGQHVRESATVRSADHEEIGTESVCERDDHSWCAASDQHGLRRDTHRRRDLARITQDRVGVGIVQAAGERQRRRKSPDAIFDRGNDVHDREFRDETLRKLRGDSGSVTPGSRAAGRQQDLGRRRRHPAVARGNRCSRVVATAGWGVVSVRTSAPSTVSAACATDQREAGSGNLLALGFGGWRTGCWWAGDHDHGLSRNARSETNSRIVMSLRSAAPENPGASWTIAQSANALTRIERVTSSRRFW